MTSPPHPVEVLVDVFFGPTNEVARTPALDPWIARLHDGRPTILPARLSGDLRLYGVSPSRAAARGLSEELVAAIGPSWSDFEGAAAVLDPEVTIEAALLEYERVTKGGPTLRLRVHDRERAWRAMSRLATNWRRRPIPSDEGALLVPLPDVLRDVELALRTSAVDEAARLVEILRRRGELSSQNLLFLELRLLAAGGRSSEVLRHPRLDDVLHAHRPVGVTSMLFDVIDTVLFADHAAANDAEAAMRVFRERVAQQFAPLISSGPDLTSVAALQVRILSAVDAGARRDQAAELARAADPGDQPWLLQLAALGSEPTTPTVKERVGVPAPDPVALAREATWNGDHRRVIELLSQVTPSVASVELLVGAALGAGGLQSARVASDAFSRLEASDQEALRRLPLVAGPLEQLLALGGDAAVVDSWRQWLSRLSADEPFPAAVEVAELGALEWTTTEPTSESEATALAEALTAAPSHARESLERALPHLLTYLDRRPQPDDVALPVQAAILEVLAYGESRTRAVREAVLTVLSRLLEGGLAAADYVEYVGLVEYVWEGSRSASTIGWLADVLVALVHYPCPSPPRREALAARAVADALALHDIDEVDVDVLRLVATDDVFAGRFVAEADALPYPSEAESPAPEAPPRPQSPLTVGIYTLSEPAAHRAKTVLERRYPALDVQLNHEHDDSERLRALARRADVMAMVIASAKHAATDAIRRTVRDEALIEVGTQGSTGLVRAVIGRLEELAAA